ncbi:MAG: BufA1 family periplasmic bufferin-type metallophore, partial [Gammaproteobacteria bacterium]
DTTHEEHDDHCSFGLAGALALGMLSNASAEAAKHAGEEKCAGVVKAGMNDCTTSANACHSHVEVDAHPGRRSPP